jgi:hypothetical protein
MGSKAPQAVETPLRLLDGDAVDPLARDRPIHALAPSRRVTDVTQYPIPEILP